MAEDRDIDLVLVTGAGASCQFGNDRMGGSARLPLMREWSNSLLQKLSTSGFGLQELVGLVADLDGPEFERRLGEFLALAESFPDIRRILEPSVQLQAVPPGITVQSLQSWHANVQHRLQEAVAAIHQSLVDNFGWDRTNPEAASSAYNSLFAMVGLAQRDRLVYATTNYDHVGEGALERLGRRPDSGTRRPFAGPGVTSAVKLEMDNLVEVVGRATPVLHLHGAVGWFDSPGHGPTVIESSAYSSDWGVPIAMLPSLQKDYQKSFILETIWVEFRKALRRAKKVLVLGHSLADVELLRALAEEVQPHDRLGFTYLPNVEVAPTHAVAPIWSRIQIRAQHFPLVFGANLEGNAPGFEKWDTAIERAVNESAVG